MRRIFTPSLFIFLLFLNNLVSFAQTGTPTGSDPNCLNGVSFYQKLYGGNRDDLAEWLAPAPDSGYVIAGHTRSFGNGNTDGLIMKVNKAGNIVWSKTVGGANADVFYGITRTADNGFIVVGQTKSYGNAAGDAWLVKIDAAGAIQWTRKYGNGNGVGDNAFGVVQLSDGGYALSGVHQHAGGVSQSLVIRTDNLGNVIWSKVYDQAGSDEAWGLTEDGNSLMVVGFYRAPDLYDGYVMRLDKATGAVQWKRTYDAEFGRHVMFAKIRPINSGFQVYGLINDDFSGSNVQHLIYNLNTDGTVQSVRKPGVVGTHTASYGWHPFPDGSFLVANGENTNASDPIYTKVNADGTIAWSKKYARNGKQWIRAIVPAQEGGFAAVGNNNYYGTTADSTNIYLAKFDNEGNASTCSAINTNDVTIYFPSHSSSAMSAPAADIALLPSAVNAATTSFIPVMGTICFECKQTVTIIPPDPTCPNGIAFFQRAIGGNKDDLGEAVVSTPDSGYVVAGYTKSFGSGGLDGLVTKVDRKGNVVWTKAVGGANDDRFFGMARTSDNGFIMVGQTKSFGNPAGDAWLVRMDAAGNVLWSRKYGNGNAVGDLAVYVTQLSDGGFAFSGVHQYAGGVSESFIVRTDNLGNPVWSKLYGHSGSDEAWSLTEDGNALMVVGFLRNPSVYHGYVMKIDKGTGAVQWTRSYNIGGHFNRISRLAVVNGGYQVFVLLTDDFAATNQRQGIINLATDGSVQNFRVVTVTGLNTTGYGWYPLPDGGFIVSNGDNTTSSDIIFTQVNAAGNIVWSRKHERAGAHYSRQIIKSPELGYAAVGYTNTPGTPVDSNDVFLLRIDSLGNSGTCSGSPTTDVAVINSSISTGAISVATLANLALNPTAMTANVSTVIPVSNMQCFYCQRKPLGSGRIETGRMAPVLKVFPNPVAGGNLNLTIEAGGNDRAMISIVDLNGNVIAVIGSRDVVAGKNTFKIDLPRHLVNYSTYYVQVRFTDYIVTNQVFVIN